MPTPDVRDDHAINADRRRQASRSVAKASVWPCALALAACYGTDRPAGEIVGPPRDAASLVEADARQAFAERQLAEPVNAPTGVKRILFGDLHVHSSHSLDAMAMELPYTGLQGGHPPTQACDFARYCSRLDFYGLTDHAETLTADHWQSAKDSVRRCNERAGDAEERDLVAFVGWEWSQEGLTPDQHWGHRTVLFPGIADDALPARPVSAAPDGSGIGAFSRLGALSALKWTDPLHWKQYADFDWLFRAAGNVAQCAPDTPSPRLPTACAENAPTPDALQRKLDEWDLDAMVIPHGGSWGLYAPAGFSRDKALDLAHYDRDAQPLMEIMSGHGASEVHRPWRAYDDDSLSRRCPDAAPGYLPCCQRAGEIMRERCGDLPADECERRVAAARQYAVDAGISYARVLPDATAEDWLNCGQCEDCFKPAYNYMPSGSAQYALALSNFDTLDSDGRPLRFRTGFIAASGDHAARPGTGYKQYQRREMTMASGARSAFYGRLTATQRKMDDPRVPQRFLEGSSVGLTEMDRLSSYLFAGGVAAVHSAGRDRRAIWQALKRREAYATSGPRILLWFDLLNGADGRQAMGSEASMRETPRFEVRAAGDFVQQAGCPPDSVAALGEDRLDALCRMECYHPAERRQLISAIEVVRIRPQARQGEPVDGLIEDVWRRYECPADPNGCVVRFEDREFVESGRDAVYYVRALQAPTPAINGATLRTRRGEDGRVEGVEPCWGDYRSALDDDCLAPVQERAWSSPIFVDAPR